MKVYKNQTAQSAKLLGFSSNFSFASDEVMSPTGVDITPITRMGESEPYEYEVTDFDKSSGLAKIMVMNKKEFETYSKSVTPTTNEK